MAKHDVISLVGVCVCPKKRARVFASVHLLDEFVDDGAYGFACGFGAASDLFVVGFAEVDGDACI